MNLSFCRIRKVLAATFPFSLSLAPRCLEQSHLIPCTRPCRAPFIAPRFAVASVRAKLRQCLATLPRAFMPPCQCRTASATPRVVAASRSSVTPVSIVCASAHCHANEVRLLLRCHSTIALTSRSAKPAPPYTTQPCTTLALARSLFSPPPLAIKRSPTTPFFLLDPPQPRRTFPSSPTLTAAAAPKSSGEPQLDPTPRSRP